jgi:hypothetical protein
MAGFQNVFRITGGSATTFGVTGGYQQGWAKLVLIALERYSVALKRLTFNLR